jgi:hypothetical protein
MFFLASSLYFYRIHCHRTDGPWVPEPVVFGKKKKALVGKGEDTVLTAVEGQATGMSSIKFRSTGI